MRQFTQLEITLNLTSEGSYQALIRLEHPVEPPQAIHWPNTVPMCFRFNQLQAALENPAAYGSLLAEDFFAEPAFKQAVVLLLQQLEADGGGLALHLLLAPDDAKARGLQWRDLCRPDGDAPLFDGERIKLCLAVQEQAEPSMQGQLVGPYRLERELGRGGMGVVYLGVRDDQELHMKACVKLIHRHLADREMLARFRRERQVLADLKHPHIAVLLDAGTTEDGRPYFIMEHIEGWNIDAWCTARDPDLNRLLGIRAWPQPSPPNG